MSVRDLVDRGLRLKRAIKRLQLDLKDVEAALAKVALEGKQEELKDAEREGRRFLARGSRCIIPVVFAADKLVASFKRGSDVHRRLEEVAGERLLEFYEAVEKFENKFEDGKVFREEARKVLGPVAPGFVTACLQRDKYGIPKSSTSVLWDKPELIA